MLSFDLWISIELHLVDYLLRCFEHYLFFSSRLHRRPWYLSIKLESIGDAMALIAQRSVSVENSKVDSSKDKLIVAWVWWSYIYPIFRYSIRYQRQIYWIFMSLRHFFKDNRTCCFEVNVRTSTICQKDEKIGMEKKASSIDLDFTVQIRKSRETFSVNGAHR